MKLLLFGTGRFYQGRRDTLKKIMGDDVVIGFIDNCAADIGTFEGKRVLLPMQVKEVSFDRIVLMSSSFLEMRDQLLELGIPGKKICFWSEYQAEKAGFVRKELGFCPCCDRETVFVSHSAWLRDHYQCIYCHSIPRQRALMKILDDVVPDWHTKTVHESSPGNSFIKNHCGAYSCSYFYEDRKLGERILDSPIEDVDCWNENLEQLTFPDASFDIFITQDVFEHIQRPREAFKEIARVLKSGGGCMCSQYQFTHSSGQGVESSSMRTDRFPAFCRKSIMAIRFRRREAS